MVINFIYVILLPILHTKFRRQSPGPNNSTHSVLTIHSVDQAVLAVWSSLLEMTGRFIREVISLSPIPPCGIHYARQVYY
jgi:hypothetical protein